MTNAIDWYQYQQETIAVRAGQHRSSEGEQSEALFLTSSFTFKSAAEAAARFAGSEAGNIYSRFTNPTVRTFEERLAALEGGERCVATSSGMAAILAVCMGLLKQGDHLISSRSIFGTTTLLFTNFLQKFGVEISFVPLADTAAWEAAMRPNTRLLFLETPSNPLLEIVSIAALAEIAKRHQAILAVDNCLLTPVLQRPLDLGADLVIHSATKFIDGQGRALGGAVIGGGEMMEKIYAFLRNAGPTMSAFNAWIFLKGLETLKLRIEKQSQQAMAIAQWLTAQPEVNRVHYPGLASHPQHALARQQQQGFGALLAFEVEGGQQAAWQLIDNTRIFSITANLGDTKSTITHPATTTHGRLTPQQKQASGIADGLVRLSVGLESVEDLIHDLRF
ncbi:MAG: O-succinylhomoserine sulfhydrylase [Gammaproteobacteria bacterium]|nr:O-succinylhomoserine sulfhydrylase [Gammaproteobacteria bacterium]